MNEPSMPSPSRQRAERRHRQGDEGWACRRSPVAVAAKQVCLELWKVKADLEREIGEAGSQLHRLRSGGAWVQGVSMADLDTGGHRFPAPHAI